MEVILDYISHKKLFVEADVACLYKSADLESTLGHKLAALNNRQVTQPEWQILMVCLGNKT